MTVKGNRFQRAWTTCLRLCRSPYHVANCISVVQYAITRKFLPYIPPANEQNAFGCLVVMVLLLLFRSPTIDAWLTSTWRYSQVTIVVVLGMRGAWGIATLHILVWFGLAAVWANLPPPLHVEKVVDMNAGEFKAKVLAKNAPSYVVLFTALWARSCADFAPLFAELSLEYSASITFARVDVRRFGDLAREYGVSLEGSAGQLPTIIGFEKGKEIVRMPAVTGGRVSRAALSRSNIIRFLEILTKKETKKER